MSSETRDDDAKGQPTTRPGKLRFLCKNATSEFQTLFVSTDGPVYARVLMEDSKGVRRWKLLEVGGVESAFARWLTRAADETYHFIPSQSELGDVMRLMRAHASDNRQETFARRIAFGTLDCMCEDDTPREALLRRASSRDEPPQETICIDVADEDGHLVVISAEGWDVVQPHVYANGWYGPSAGNIPFLRTGNMRALPTPERLAPGEAAKVFASLFNDIFTNVSPAQRPLILAWLVGSLNPSGPYMMLALQGPEGSFKSTTADLLQRTIDPTTATRRKLPKDDQTLLIAAQGGHALAFDNVSGTLATDRSDALCRLLTGGSFGSRTLYTDSGETVLSAKRPVILNGIDSSIVKGDLLDRTLLLDLVRVEPEQRLTEAEVLRRFDELHPRLLSALCDALVATMKARRDGKRYANLPRMADAFTFTLPALEVLGFSERAVRAALAENTERASLISLDASPLANAIERFMSKRLEWTGTATELLRLLKDQVNDVEVTRASTWPKNANQLGSWLNRDATLLRRLGIAKDSPGSRRDGRRMRLYRVRVGDDGDNTVTRASSPTSAHEISADADGDNGDNTYSFLEEEKERRPSPDPEVVAATTSASVHRRTATGTAIRRDSGESVVTVVTKAASTDFKRTPAVTTPSSPTVTTGGSAVTNEEFNQILEELYGDRDDAVMRGAEEAAHERKEVRA